MKNKNQFLAACRSLTQQALDDVCERVKTIMREQSLTKRGVADMLGVSVSEVENVINKANVSLATYLSVLTAFGLTVVVMSMDEIEKGHVQGTASEKRPSSKLATATKRTATPKAAPSTPKRDAHGRFLPKDVVEQLPCEEASEEAINIETLSRKELVHLVVEEGWAGEIDLENADRGEIIEFVGQKLREKAEQSEPITEACFANDGDDEAQRYFNQLINSLKNNPTLVNAIKSALA